jgi:PTH2 family peptidyl-tRNA hydrolase
MNAKQVIVMRKDLGMRRGKEIAQAAHASIAFLSHKIRQVAEGFWPSSSDRTPSISAILQLTPAEQEWLGGTFTKVCCRVDSEEELLEVYHKAREAGLQAHLITDSGLTEFHGVPTKTCLAIGPDDAEQIDKVTGNLKLY